MTGEAENRNQFEDLIIGHFDGTLNEEQEKELADALTSSGEAKQTFLSYMRMEGRLHSLGRDGFLREPPAGLALSDWARWRRSLRSFDRSASRFDPSNVFSR